MINFVCLDHFSLSPLFPSFFLCLSFSPSVCLPVSLSLSLSLSISLFLSFFNSFFLSLSLSLSLSPLSLSVSLSFSSPSFLLPSPLFSSPPFYLFHHLPWVSNPLLPALPDICWAISGVNSPDISPVNTHVRKGMLTPNARESSETTTASLPLPGSRGR